MLDYSCIGMVDLCLSQVVRYWNGYMKTGLKKPVQNVQYSNGPPSHMTLPFEYRTSILSSIQMNPVFSCLVFRWLLYFARWESEKCASSVQWESE